MVAADIAELFRASRRLHQKGQLTEAEACCRRVLAAQPNHADAMNLMGLIAHQKGRHEIALEMIRRAIQRDDKMRATGPILAMCSIVVASSAKQSSRIIRRSASKPDFAEVYCNLASALKEQGKLDEAVTANRHAIRIKAG
jgi:predicted Zn-dependent protease